MDQVTEVHKLFEEDREITYGQGSVHARLFKNAHKNWGSKVTQRGDGERSQNKEKKTRRTGRHPNKNRGGGKLNSGKERSGEGGGRLLTAVGSEC